VTREEILSVPGGPELDLLVAEHVLGWEWIQAPTFDYHGPLPEQGKVLKPRDLIVGEPHCLQWPPVGIIPPSYFVNGRAWSRRVDRAWELLIERFSKSYFSVDHVPSADPDCWFCEIHDYRQVGRLAYAEAPTAPMAICRGALFAVLGL
jgi:hypothetical protein